jgi:hypothetical protein
MLHNYFNSCVCACSLCITAQIKKNGKTTIDICRFMISYLCHYFLAAFIKVQNCIMNKAARWRGYWLIKTQTQLFPYPTFHVITWLLSFFYQDYIFHAHVLSSFDPSAQRLHRWSRLCRYMSPQKLFFCYHLPTRGRAGVKLVDAWYVSNVSIIFDAPCLFLHHLPNVLLHFMALLCIFRN